MKKLALITITCLATIALLLLAWQLLNVVEITLVAVILATTMSGFLTILVNRGWSQWGARIAIIVGTLLFIAFFLSITFYAVGERLPKALEDFRTMYAELRTELFSGNSAQRAISARMPHPILLDDMLLGRNGSGLLKIISGISTNFGTLLSNIVLVIFVALYWVADRDRIERLWLSLLSPSQRTKARHLVHDIEDAIGTNLRSQIVKYGLALILFTVGYSLFGMSYAFLLAWLASLLWLIPLIGAVLALIPAFLLGLIDGYGMALSAMLYTVVIFVVVPLFVQRFNSIRQQPGSILGLMVTIALIDAMGIVGVVVAVPVTVALHVLIGDYLNASPTPTTDAPQVQLEAMLNKLTVIENKIQEGAATISPQTISMFDRLSEMVTAVELKG